MCCCGWAEPAKSCSTERPICSRRTPLQVIHAEADCLWLSSVDDVAVGDLVSQLHCAGHKQDLERAFVDAWKQRWDRHRDMSPDRWPVMTDFARAHMPRLQLDWPSLWLLTLSILHLCPKNAQELYCRCEKSSPQCVGESVLHVSWCRSHWGVAIPAPWMRLTALQRLISLNRPWITDQSRCRGLCTEFGVRTMRRKPYVLLTPSCLTRYMVGVLRASQARFGVNFCGLLKILRWKGLRWQAWLLTFRKPLTTSLDSLCLKLWPCWASLEVAYRMGWGVVRVGPQVPVGAKPRVPCLQCHGSTWRGWTVLPGYACCGSPLSPCVSPSLTWDPYHRAAPDGWHHFSVWPSLLMLWTCCLTPKRLVPGPFAARGSISLSLPRAFELKTDAACWGLMFKPPASIRMTDKYPGSTPSSHCRPNWVCLPLPMLLRCVRSRVPPGPKAYMPLLPPMCLCKHLSHYVRQLSKVSMMGLESVHLCTWAWLNVPLPAHISGVYSKHCD